MVDFKLIVIFEGNGHLLQKNYLTSPVRCDRCGDTRIEMILVGGGVRHCLKCHIQSCSQCTITVQKIVDEVEAK